MEIWLCFILDCLIINSLSLNWSVFCGEWFDDYASGFCFVIIIIIQRRDCQECSQHRTHQEWCSWIGLQPRGRHQQLVVPEGRKEERKELVVFVLLQSQPTVSSSIPSTTLFCALHLSWICTLLYIFMFFWRLTWYALVCRIHMYIHALSFRFKHILVSWNFSHYLYILILISINDDFCLYRPSTMMWYLGD